MELDNIRRKQLSDALCDAFRDWAKLERMLDHYVDVRLSKICREGDLEDVAFNVIDWFDEHGKLDELIAGACTANPTNARLRPFCDGLLPPELRARYAAHLRAQYDRADLRGLGPLAYWLHAERPEGVATRDEVARILAEAERAEHPDEDPMPQVYKVLETLSAEVGLLTEKGAGQWAFSHQTFQEYFAAREITRRRAKLHAEIARRARDPRWSELIRLAIAYVGSEIGDTDDATDLVETAILQTDDPYEPYLHRHLLLAGRVISDEPGVDHRVALDVAQRVFDLWLDTRVAALAESAGKVVRALLKVRVLHDPLLKWVGTALATNRSIARFDVLAEDEAVQAALLARLSDADRFVRRVAAQVLAVVAGEPAVQAALLARLSDAEGTVRWAAVVALWEHAKEPAVQAALLACLLDAERWVHEAAGAALAESVGEPAVQAALLACLLDKNNNVRVTAAKTLAGVAGEPTVQAALLARLSDADNYVRRAAAEALAGSLGEPVVQAALLALLPDRDEEVCLSAVKALSRVAGDPTVQAALLVRLTDPEGRVREAAAVALTAGTADSTRQACLLACLSDRDRDVRRAATQALAESAGEPAVQAALLARLSDRDGEVRRAAAGALRNASPDFTLLRRLGVLVRERWSGIANSAFATIEYWAERELATETGSRS